eukprot:scaffold13049_cov100-Skeletonema_dohrnii-CCMP3373.AAC.3
MSSSCCVGLKYMHNQISCWGRSLDPFRPVASTLIFGSLLPLPRLELIGYSCLEKKGNDRTNNQAIDTTDYDMMT